MSGVTAEASGISTDWGQAIFGLVSAVLFCAMGLFASWVLGRMLYDGHRAREWVPAKATVNAFGAHTAAYQYEFGGVRYFGNRLGANPIDIGDNIDSWQEKMAAMLKSAYRSQQPITIWVNAANPGESMVDRDVRWKLAIIILPFAVAFGSTGVVLLWVTLRRISGTPEYGHDEGSPSLIWVIAFVLNSVLVPLAILFFHDALSKRSLEAAMYGVGALLFGAGAIRAAMAASARRRERGPTDPTELRARLVRQREAMARLAQREREEDLPPFLVFMGLIAAFLLGIWLMIRIMGPGHA
ncbi:MAG: DUF3592 domain-containing protein [Burkholderiales bacterium]|nr:DUF3592 domain-containing protein [Burkholderiales bacterium]